MMSGVPRVVARASCTAALGMSMLLLWPGCAPTERGRITTGHDVVPEYRNREATALVGDSETVRLALGAAWDDALACRAMSGYLRPWRRGDWREEAEAQVRHGTALYELVKCVDDGIESVRLARDSRDEPRLGEEIRFWRNELALAAKAIAAYASRAAALKVNLASQLADLARQQGIAAQVIEGKPWGDPQRGACNLLRC